MLIFSKILLLLLTLTHTHTLNHILLAHSCKVWPIWPLYLLLCRVIRSGYDDKEVITPTHLTLTLFYLIKISEHAKTINKQACNDIAQGSAVLLGRKLGLRAQYIWYCVAVSRWLEAHHSAGWQHDPLPGSNPYHSHIHTPVTMHICITHQLYSSYIMHYSHYSGTTSEQGHVRSMAYGVNSAHSIQILHTFIQFTHM
jgi:hypothetical protein